MLGCPPNLHVQFDWNATKQRLYEKSIQQTPIDCLYPDPTLPCFYFDNGKWFVTAKWVQAGITWVSLAYNLGKLQNCDIEFCTFWLITWVSCKFVTFSFVPFGLLPG